MADTDFSAVQEVLQDVDFPATKDQLVEHADGRGDPGVVRLLRALPLATYRNISEIRSSVDLNPSQTPDG